MNSKLIGLLKVTAISFLSLAALALFSGEGEVSSSEGEVQPYSPPTPPLDQLPLVIEDMPLVIEPEVCEGGTCVPSSTSQNCQPTRRRRFFQRFFRR